MVGRSTAWTPPAAMAATPAGFSSSRWLTWIKQREACEVDAHADKGPTDKGPTDKGAPPPPPPQDELRVCHRQASNQGAAPLHMPTPPPPLARSHGTLWHAITASFSTQ